MSVVCQFFWGVLFTFSVILLSSKYQLLGSSLPSTICKKINKHIQEVGYTEIQWRSQEFETGGAYFLVVIFYSERDFQGCRIAVGIGF